MPTSSNGDYPLQLEFSGVIAATIPQLQRRASRENRGKAFLLALRQIIKRLRANLMNFGKPLYRLPDIRMQIRTAVIRPIYVDFAFCEDRPLVFIKAVRLLSASGS